MTISAANVSCRVFIFLELFNISDAVWHLFKRPLKDHCTHTQKKSHSILYPTKVITLLKHILKQSKNNLGHLKLIVCFASTHKQDFLYFKITTQTSFYSERLIFQKKNMKNWVYFFMRCMFCFRTGT